MHDHLANLIAGRQGTDRPFLLNLRSFYERHSPTSRARPFHLPLSQAHIGQALGLTYVHVSRTLHILREQKVVRFANRILEIIDPPSLMAAAGIEAEFFNGERPFSSPRLLRTTSSLSDGALTGALPAEVAADAGRLPNRRVSSFGTDEFSSARAA